MNLDAFQKAVSLGVDPIDAAAEINRPTDPPRVRAVTHVLKRYGHRDWARERARNLCSVLCAGVPLTAQRAHEIISSVIVDGKPDRFVVPFSAATEALEAWRAGGEQ